MLVFEAALINLRPESDIQSDARISSLLTLLGLRSDGITFAMSDYEWVKRPPNIIERIVAGAFVTVLLLAYASSYAGWRIFGEHDGTVAVGATVFGVILIRLLPQARRKPPA